MPTKRTTLLLDPELIAEASQILGTKGTTDTVRASLEETVRRARVRNLVAWELGDASADELDRRRSPRRFEA